MVSAFGTGPTPIDTSNPQAETNPATASAGSNNKAADSGHVHAIASPATPSTQAFGDAASQGAGTGFATDTHKHAMPTTWVKVAAGTLASATGLDLTSLSGYRRYHLIITARHSNADGGGTWTLKLNNKILHDAQRIKLSNATATTSHQASAATVTLGATLNTAPTAQQENQLDLLVSHDGSNAACMVGSAFFSAMSGTGSTSEESDIVFYDEQDSVTSITEINVAFGVTLAGGHYVLYGSNETS